MVEIKYFVNGIECLHITGFAQRTGKSVPSIRHLVEVGNAIRQLAHARHGSRIYIPVFEVEGFSFTSAGPGNLKDVFHYKDGHKYLCEQCTYGTPCEKALEANKAAEAFHATL